MSKTIFLLLLFALASFSYAQDTKTAVPAAALPGLAAPTPLASEEKSQLADLSSQYQLAELQEQIAKLKKEVAEAKFNQLQAELRLKHNCPNGILRGQPVEFSCPPKAAPTSAVTAVPDAAPKKDEPKKEAEKPTKAPPKS